MNIDSRYPIRHKFLLAGSGERAAVTLTRVTGYRRSPRGRQRRPIICSNTHAPDQTSSQPQVLQCGSDLAAPDRYDLTLSEFHKVSRAAGPKRQARQANQDRSLLPCAPDSCRLMAGCSNKALNVGSSESRFGENGYRCAQQTGPLRSGQWLSPPGDRTLAAVLPRSTLSNI